MEWKILGWLTAAYAAFVTWLLWQYLAEEDEPAGGPWGG